MKRISLLFLVLLNAFLSFGQDDFDSSIKKANEAINNSDYKEALKNFEAAFAVGNADSTKITWYGSVAGICAQELGDHDKAIEMFLMALEYGATSKDIYDRLLELAKKNKKTDVEEKTLLFALKNLPGEKRKYESKLLYFYYNSQRFDQAIKQADVILENQPDQIRVMYMKSLALYGLENTESACDELNKILTLEPENAGANSMMGIIYYRLATNDYDNYVAQYKKLAKPTRGDYAVYLRNIETSYPMYRKALSYLLKAYELKPDNKVKAAIYNSYIRLEQKDTAMKYR